MLDGEQDIEPLEHHGVDREEVCRQDALGLYAGNAIGYSAVTLDFGPPLRAGERDS